MPAQDASLSINDPKYFALSQAAEETPAAKQCPAWDKALSARSRNYDVKPMGVSKNVWFAKGWKFAAPYDVLVDPFTLFRRRNGVGAPRRGAARPPETLGAATRRTMR